MSILKTLAGRIAICALALSPLSKLEAQVNASAYTAPNMQVGSLSDTLTAYVNFSAAGVIGNVAVLTQGAPNLDFKLVTDGTCSIGNTYSAGTSCWIRYTFSPTSAGARQGGIVVTTSTGTVMGTSYLAGTGVAPLGLFTTTSQALTLTGFTAARGLSTDGFNNIYVSNNGILTKFAHGSTTPQALSLNLNSAGATAVDGAGNVYITSNTGNELYELVGGKGSLIPIASLTQPDDNLVADGAGNLYCSNESTGAIYKIAAGTHAVTTVLAGGAGHRFVALSGDAAGNVYAPDFNTNVLYELKAGASTLTTLVSGGSLNNPHGVATDPAGNIYVTNYNGANTLRYAAGNYDLTVLPAAGQRGIVIDGSGNLYSIVSDATIEEFSRTNAPTLTYPNTQAGLTSTPQQGSVEFENDGNAPLVITSYNGTTNFAIGSANTCEEGSLASGATCQIAALFSPTALGALSGYAVIEDNTMGVEGTSQNVPLSGSGIQGSQVISFTTPTTLTYGWAPLPLTATGGESGLPITYTVTGPASINGSNLTVTGAGMIIVTAHQAGNSIYAAATPVSQVIAVAQATQTITFNPPASASGAIVLSATGGASGNPVTYSVTGPATLAGNVLTPTGSGNVVVTASQLGNNSYASATAVVKTINFIHLTQTITFTIPASASAETTITLNGVGGGSGNPVNYTVTGPATVTGNVLTLSGAGTVVVTANQAGNAAYAAAAPVSQTLVSSTTSIVTLSAESTAYTYPNSTNLQACVQLTIRRPAKGTVSFYDGSKLLATETLNGGGCYTWHIAPMFNIGTHSVVAYYNDANNTNVFSNTVVITVAVGKTVAEVDCSGAHFDFGKDFSCDANPDSGPRSGYMTYTYDGGTPVVVQMNSASHALFTIPTPAVGPHTVIITYPAQGNYGAFQLPIQNFVVAPAGVNLFLVPSSFYTKDGTPLTLTASLSSYDIAAPSGVGTVSFYDGSTLIGTSPVNSAGVASFTDLKLAIGYHSITANFSGTSIYGTATQTIQIQIGQY